MAHRAEALGTVFPFRPQGWIAVPLLAAAMLGTGSAALAQMFPGDYDRDGELSVADAFAMFEALDGYTTFDAERGDVDRNGIFDRSDAGLVLDAAHHNHGHDGIHHFLPPVPPGRPIILGVAPNHTQPGDVVMIHGEQFFDVPLVPESNPTGDTGVLAFPLAPTGYLGEGPRVFFGEIPAPVLAAYVTHDGQGSGADGPGSTGRTLGSSKGSMQHLEVLVPAGLGPSSLVSVMNRHGAGLASPLVTVREASLAADARILPVGTTQGLPVGDESNWFQAAILEFAKDSGVAKSRILDLHGIVYTIGTDLVGGGRVSGSPGWIQPVSFDLSPYAPGAVFDLVLWVRIPPETGTGLGSIDFRVWMEPVGLAAGVVVKQSPSFDWGQEFDPNSCIDNSYGLGGTNARNR